MAKPLARSLKFYGVGSHVNVIPTINRRSFQICPSHQSGNPHCVSFPNFYVHHDPDPGGRIANFPSFFTDVRGYIGEE